ncbi:bifunctional folylpolyglutamate synthase/dihydrofolate synthase [Maribacter algicola]|uniref:Bifunctional folylpolyglutamate synthase/dihydrofolate synthase n=1 Tax=Meishania litoralis TaxID=3434685 RepID=A0ACC7LMV3_9FLAO
MTYEETLDWMFSRLPMYQQKGKTAYTGKLDNIKALSEYLGNPETKFKSIHVAGTNGKGSSSHMLASILQEAGYKVGLYTSPHLKDFRERIRINGKPVHKKFVIDFVARNKSFFELRQLSFFEMTVGMAFQYFAEGKVHIAVIEVGLGGRLDSTNIIVPEVCLITNIGMDHVDFLGDTLQKIAWEKAGIIKEGVPVIISEYQDAVASIFESVAKDKDARLVFAQKEILHAFDTSLLGEYQHKNVKGVIATVKELKSLKVREKEIRSGLLKVVENTGLLGRWQMLKDDPKVICDTAHNSEGLSLVLEQIRKQKYDKLHIVLGFVKDKNLDTILPLFPKNADYYFASPNISRGLDVAILEQKAAEIGLKGEGFSSVDKAFTAALKNAKKNDFIFVGGSTFVVAEVV